MGKKNVSVNDFVNELDHSDEDLINKIRETITESSSELKEGIKWNAPSYSFNNNDIITFNFRNFGNVSLIFHTGPKGKDTHTGKHLFNEYSEIIEWVADKRFVIKIPDSTWIEQNRSLLRELVLRWIERARNDFAYES